MEIKVFTITKEKELATFKLSGNFKVKTMKMEIKIKNNNEYIPATLEVVDGVMIVSPKEEKVDITQFKDCDIITCGDKSCSWTCVLRGEIEKNTDFMLIAEYCNVDSEGDYSCEDGDSNFVTWVRYATEEEKQKLFDALEKSGYRWDAEKKAVVQVKWKPYIGEIYYYPMYKYCSHLFKSYDCIWADLLSDNDIYNRGWCFKTKEECEAFCKRLNESIMGVKPCK